MGYTHYWTPTNKTEFTPKVEEVIKSITNSAYADNLIQQESDINLPPIVDNNSVFFNGVGEAGHETFHFVCGSEWNFCKTAEKPYDIIVVAVLTVLRLTGFAKVTSDGREKDWQKGKELAVHHLMKCGFLPVDYIQILPNEYEGSRANF